MKHITDFYKELFGPPDISGIRMLNIEMNKLLEEQKEETFHNGRIGRGSVSKWKTTRPLGLMVSLLTFIKSFWGSLKGT